jgi:hypothetical protein
MRTPAADPAQSSEIEVIEHGGPIQKLYRGPMAGGQVEQGFRKSQSGGS